MSTYGQVKTWSATDLEAAADDLVARSASLRGLQDELGAADRTLLWKGETADAAAAAHSGLSERVRRLVAQVAAVRTALDEAGDSVQALRALIAETAFYAARYQLVITPEGVVRDNLPSSTVLSPEENADRERAYTEIYDQIQQTMSTAADVDADVAAVMLRAVHDEIDDGSFPGLDNADIAGAAEGNLSAGAPPKDASPFDNAAWWDSLSPQQQTDIAAVHPEWVGNLDGIPGAVRSEANLAQLDGERAALVAREAEVIAELDDNLFGGAFTNADAELADVRAKIASVDAVSKVMNSEDRQLLLLDLSGDRAMAAISYGDVDTADHVSVFTPGLNTTVDGNIGSYDEQNRRLNDEVVDQLDRNGQGGTIATVTWIGYQAPQAHNPDWTNPGSIWDNANGVQQVATPDSARAGGASLTSFLNGMNASRPTDPHLTALGHSYGSLATSYGLQGGTGVDDVVLFGSPGLGTGDVTDLNVDAGHVYLMEAERDPVGDFGVFGGDPSSLAGLTHLDTGGGLTPDGRTLDASHGHSEYYDDGDRHTMSAYNMAAIVSGNPDDAVYGSTPDVGDLLRDELPG